MATLKNEVKEFDYNTFTKIISNIPSNIFFKDTELKYRFCTHKWAQLNSNDIVGKTDLEVRKDKENAILAMEADREILRSKKGCSYVIKSDIDGEVSYLELIKEPIIGDDGEAIGIVGLINDVTEKTLMAQKLQELSEQLEERCAELGNTNEELKTSLQIVEQMNSLQKMFTASINHELRSPLNGIIGLLQILKDEGSLSKSQESYVDNAFKSSQLMLEIVNDLLDHAKLETGEFNIINDEFDLRDVIESVDEVTKKLAEGKGLDFEIIIKDDLYCKYIGDEVRIKQILNNLLSNAVKYTEKGKVTLSIDYSDEMLSIMCTDTGQGISEESIKVLFDPYVRLNEKKNKNINGTGLGLSIVKRMIDAMDGSILVESTVNKSTTFYVKIPMEVYDKTVTFADKKMRDVPDAKAVAKDFSALSVLCVDDIKVNITVFSGLLKNTGIKIDKAYSGKEAIEKSNANKYDIIFVDHQMPDLDGIDTYKIIRQESGYNKETPVVIMTANAGKEYEEKYNEIGFDGYLSKPVLKEKLIEMIEKVVL